MTSSLSLRCFVVGALLIGCSPSPSEPGLAASGGEANGGSAAQSPASSGAGGGVIDARPDGGSAASGGVASGGAASGGADAGTSSGGSAGGPRGTVPVPVTWKPIATAADSSVSISVPSVASRGKDAAVAYVERSTGRVMMQRFDATGERIDSPIQLASDAVERSNVTLASDGKQYAACWNVAVEVHCSLIDEQGKVHLNALALSGQYSTIVANAAGWAIAYTGSDKHLFMRPLGPTLALAGEFVATQRFAQFSARDVGPLFAATPSGYVLVAANEEGGEVELQRLGSDFQAVGSATALGHPLWQAAQLVASDTRAAVSLSVPYGSFLQLLDDKKLTAELPIAGGGKGGTDQALLLTEGGIGAAWLDRNVAVRRRLFANGHDSDIGLESRTPSNAVLGMEEEGSESYQQLVQIGSQSLLVAKASRYGALSMIRVAPLNFGD